MQREEQKVEVPYESPDPTGPGALYGEYSADPALMDKERVIKTNQGGTAELFGPLQSA